MRIGKYRIGKYHAIIKKIYEDGSVDYETSFSSENDLMESVYAIQRCIGKMIGIATDNPKVLIDMDVIRGKNNIIKELLIPQKTTVNEEISCAYCDYCRWPRTANDNGGACKCKIMKNKTIDVYVSGGETPVWCPLNAKEEKQK